MSKINLSGIILSLCAISLGFIIIGIILFKMDSDKSVTPPVSLTEELNASGFELGDPVFLRIIKTTEENSKGQIEAFIDSGDGKYEFFKSWETCTWSGELGPKFKEGDKQSPEGFYSVSEELLNPNSSYHLSFNLGYPNEYDQFHGRTGSFLMIHGECSSIGCYAMGNPNIEQIYSLVQSAIEMGQQNVAVHAVPFPMTAENIEKYNDNDHIEFWRNLKEGSDFFETNKHPPKVSVTDGEYSFK